MPDQPESGLVSPCLTGLEVPLLRNANDLKLVEKYWLDAALAEESGYLSTAATSVRGKYWRDEGTRIFSPGARYHKFTQHRRNAQRSVAFRTAERSGAVRGSITRIT